MFQLLMKKLQDTEITWELPWYQQSKCLTRPVVVNNGQVEENFRTGKISKDESDRIHKNWRKFRKVYVLHILYNWSKELKFYKT